MTKPEYVRCDTCVYWDRVGAAQSGRCHAGRPPAVGSARQEWEWTVVYWDEWCGLWASEWPPHREPAS